MALNRSSRTHGHLLGLLLVATPCVARASADSPGGVDLSFDIAPWGLYEFEDTIGPSVGVHGAVEIGSGLGFGALYRGLGDLGGMAGVFGRFAGTPVLTPKKPFVSWFVDAGVVGGLGGLGGAALYASGAGQVGYATSENVGLVGGLGLTTFVGASSTSVSSVQVPVVSLGLIYRTKPK